jgi:class 3 adenylate cyclase/tetratricopeptide (TPR) repeat protein
MSSIFVSYRRNDAPAHAGRIYDRLAERVGKDNVYMDLDSTVPGADFGDVIEQTIAQCDALIAVIGRDWVSALRPSRRARRADRSEDWVRREMAAALARNIRVMPVLVQGAKMPSSAELPDDIKGLARRHAIELSDTAWSAQLGLLIDALPVATATSASAGGLQPSSSGRGHDQDRGLPARALAATAVERADVSAEPPTGTVTLLFTDIEGSTRLLQRQRDRYANLLADHDRLLRNAFAAHDGREIGTRGDGFFVAFRRARDAVRAAVDAQRSLAAHGWPDGDELRVRMGLHSGEPTVTSDNYIGLGVHRAARICAAGHGGQILLSNATRELVADDLSHDVALTDLGEHWLKDLDRPEHLYQVLTPDLARDFPPLNAATATSEPARVGLPLPRPLHVATECPLIGRDQEVARVRQLWTKGIPGAHAAIVAGEAGIGKTRLAAELALGVHGEGALVLYGRCDEGLGVPYQPWVEALRPAAEVMGLDRLRAELGHLAPHLTRLLPELDALGRPASADPETERYNLFEAVTALLETATRAQRLLLVLDDLHWAARPTLLLLRHLVRSERPLRALVLGTYRETDLAFDHPLPQLLADLQRDASATTVRIGGLDECGIAALLQATAGHALDAEAMVFVRRLQAATGGNPFFIRELLADLVESGAIYRAGERWTTDLAAAELAVPEGLRHVIRQRVARLSEPAGHALAVAAVAGPTCSLWLLEGVLGERSALLDGLDESVSAGLLTEAEPGDYAFAHALVRQTIYEQHSAARRMRLHRQLGEALETRADADAHVEALAHHFAQAAADGQATKAAAYALAAGRNATARVAYEDAAAHYERGLRALDLASAPEEERRGELLLALADARWSSGDMDKAREAGRLAVEVADRSADPEQLARAALAFAGPVRFEAAAAVAGPLAGLLERALEALDESDSALRARVMARLAAVLAFSAPRRRRPALAYQALEMARRVGDKRTLVEVLSRSSSATLEPDNLDERRATANELARLAAEVGDRAFEAGARRWSVVNLLELGDIDAAERELAACDRLADALHQRYPRYMAAIVRAGHAHLQGRLADFDALAHHALGLGLEGHDEMATQAFGAHMLYLRREQGRLGELVDAVSDLVERYPEIPNWRCAVAFVYAELDRRRDAQRELEALARHDFADLPRDFTWMLSIAVLSEVVAFLGDVRRAELLYQLLFPFADRCVVIDGPICCLGSASRPLGLLATTMGRMDAAARHLEDALDMNSKIRSPLWVAHTQHDYAHTLLRRDHPGDRDKALKLLAAALATADKLGLKALADKTQRLKHQAEATASALREPHD